MRHRHDRDGCRTFSNPDRQGSGDEHKPHRGRRPFDYGRLRLIVLAMISEQPRHGYELMRAIEERMGGGYSPSPGVIYPTLSWLEDMGFAACDAEAGRKTFRITPEGEAFLAANRLSLDELTARMAPDPRPGRGGRHGLPEAIPRSMDRLKLALRQRFAQGPVPEEMVARIADAIASAALVVEQSTMDETMEQTVSNVRAMAEVATPKAAGYAAQLCKHFAHKIPARFEDGRGEITFGAGICHLEATDDLLTLTVEAADAAGLETLKDVVARHLLRFAFREELSITWSDA